MGYRDSGQVLLYGAYKINWSIIKKQKISDRKKKEIKEIKIEC